MKLITIKRPVRRPVRRSCLLRRSFNVDGSAKEEACRVGRPGQAKEEEKYEEVHDCYCWVGMHRFQLDG